ncbi:MAG: hypothetical protein RLZZ584_172 [Pseudomonadota bacterium]
MPAVLWRRRPVRATRAVLLDLDLSEAGAAPRHGTASGGPRSAPQAIHTGSQVDALQQRLAAALLRCAGSGTRGALMHARIDGLPLTLAASHAGPGSRGTAAVDHGQRALDSLADALRAALPPGSWVAVDTSGYAWLLLQDMGTPAVVLGWARRVEQVLARSSCVGASSRVALGLCLFPDQADSARDVQVAASAASAQAQADRGSGASRSAFYDHERAERARSQGRDALQLASALEHGGLELRLQGRAFLRGGALSAAQVELSWPRRKGDRERGEQTAAVGAGGPDGVERRRARRNPGSCRGLALERLAAQAGLVEELGRALLTRSCQQLAAWHRQGVGVPALALRLPSAWVTRADFGIELTRLLKRHHLHGRQLRLELGAAALRALQGDAGHLLIDAGVELTADVTDVDLATLAACRQLPVTSLAVDLAQLGDITRPGQARASLTTLAMLARSLGMRVLVKSVDHAEELELLGQLDCDEYQGAVLARPLPARTWTTLLVESAVGNLTDHAQQVRAQADTMPA